MINQNRLATLFGLEGRVAVVTGGAAGLGREIAQLLGDAGATVVVADRDALAAKTTCEAMNAAGLTAHALVADVMSERSVAELFDAVSQQIGSVDILVNNAGAFPKSPLTEITLEQWDQVQQLNLRGPFLCMRAAIRQMQAAGKGGRIVNVSSVASIHPATFANGAYSASKAGLNQLTRSAALDYAGAGITVNAVCPGAMRTEGASKLAASIEMKGPALDPGRWILGRHGEAQEVAAVILYLVGPAGSYATGQTFVIDGGFLVS